MKKFAALALAACLFLTAGCAPASINLNASSDSTPASVHEDSPYVPMTLAKARDAADGTAVQVEGVVVQITYGLENTPTGFLLADNTNSILISDRDLASQVQVGNRICLQAIKKYWIAEAEAGYAQQFGYGGSCQLEQARLISNDGRTDNAYDHSWIPEISIKELLEIPVSENITTSMYKVHTYIRMEQAQDCTNYYFLDLDGVTGSYVYTQCGGADFQWLAAYDGKICELYLSVINAKSTEDGCIYRFLPVQMLQADYKFQACDVPEYIIEYYAMEQFQSSYSSDPAQVLLTSISSSLLDFENARLNYYSSDDTVLDVRVEDGRVYLHAVGPGTATITVIAYYDAYAYSQTVEITVTDL